MSTISESIVYTVWTHFCQQQRTKQTNKQTNMSVHTAQHIHTQTNSVSVNIDFISFASQFILTITIFKVFAWVRSIVACNVIVCCTEFWLNTHTHSTISLTINCTYLNMFEHFSIKFSFSECPLKNVMTHTRTPTQLQSNWPNVNDTPNKWSQMKLILVEIIQRLFVYMDALMAVAFSPIHALLPPLHRCPTDA